MGSCAVGEGELLKPRRTEERDTDCGELPEEGKVSLNQTLKGNTLSTGRVLLLLIQEPNRDLTPTKTQHTVSLHQAISLHPTTKGAFLHLHRHFGQHERGNRQTCRHSLLAFAATCRLQLHLQQPAGCCRQAAGLAPSIQGCKVKALLEWKCREEERGWGKHFHCLKH